MVDIVILGTVGLDDIKTPFGEVKGVLGGSATYAAVAASFFANPGIISIIGSDFPEESKEFLKSRSIDLKGIKIIDGKTFRWGGYYEFDMNEAKTLKTELNVLAGFSPEVPNEYRDVKVLFLANVDPKVQMHVLEQMKKTDFVVMDTMNFWITTKKETLLRMIKKVDLLLLNDSEARQLFGTTNLVIAAKEALKLGPKFIIIKKGEHGSLMFSDGTHFNAPGYPLENTKDPTGCGDSFGGSLAGYLASTEDYSEKNIRKAIVFASAVASCNAEEFSLNKLKNIDLAHIQKRYSEMKEFREF